MQILYERMTPDVVKLLIHIGELSQRRGEQVFLVGGMVRDLFSGSPNIDIDIVVEGAAPELARDLARELRSKIRIHDTFQTATLFIADNYKVDFASARTEFYPYPAALPTIESAGLREDLYRRDFTVNAMAISLNPGNFGELIDYFCGYRDFTEGLIRVLHNLSFVEDPTRIMRALRFAVKFGWQIEKGTYGFMLRALKENRLQEISSVRLWNELKQILLEKNPFPILKVLGELGIDRQLFPGVSWGDQVFDGLEFLQGGLSKFHSQGLVVPWRVYLTIILSPYSLAKIKETLRNYGLKRKDKLIIEDAFTLQLGIPKVNTFERKDISLFHTYWRRMANDSILAWAVLSNSRGIMDLACSYIENRSNFKPRLSGYDLLELGVRAGPEMGIILQELELAWLEKRVASEEEELILAQKLAKGDETRQCWKV